MCIYNRLDQLFNSRVKNKIIIYEINNKPGGFGIKRKQIYNT